MAKIGFPSNPFNKKQLIVDSKLYEYNSELGVWGKGTRSPVSSGPTNVTDVSSLVDNSNLLSNASSTIPVYPTEVDVLSQSIGVHDGQLAYAQDTNRMYVYSGESWYKSEISTVYTPAEVLYGDRGVIAGGGGSNSSASRRVEYFNLVTGTTVGNFSDSTINGSTNSGGSTTNGSRMVFCKKGTGLAYMSIPDPTTDEVNSFGQLTQTCELGAGTGDGIYGVFFGCVGSNNDGTDAIQYITIDTTGNATVFGDQTEFSQQMGDTGVSDKTRGIYAGGKVTAGNYIDTIAYITIATPGNATNFGDLQDGRETGSGCHDETRGVFIAGANNQYGQAASNKTDYITMATTGNSTNFGDLSVEKKEHMCLSNGTYGYAISGYERPSGSGSFSNIREIQQFTIQTNSTATDIGDIDYQKYGGSASSGYAS